MKMVHVFLGVDMRKQHTGLEEYAKLKRINLKELPEGTACVFWNRDRSKIKTYSYNGVLGYLRAEKNRPFDPAAIEFFAKAFDPNGQLNYRKALRMRLEKVFAVSGPLKEQKL